ncbi:PKD domain-containing protein [Kitasatospora sp. NPDC088351]|uniref:PKD domain-containing protein n=1 Tax=Kitasatospora sp. NPDC088351 TaxID=3155180 RepID=UPI003438C596
MRIPRILGLTAAAATVVLGVPLPALAAPATTLYVDNTSATACSDTGAGTQAQPYCTITRAAQVVEPGQTVEVRGRFYSGDVKLTRSGTPDKPITFIGLPYGTAPWDLPQLSPRDTALTVTGAHDVVVRGFYLGTPDAVVVTGSHHVTLDQNYFSLTHSARPSVRVTGQSDHVTVSRNEFRLVGGVSADPGTHDITVSTNEFIGPYSGVSATDSPGSAVTNNTIVSACGPGVALNGTSAGASVENNILIGYGHQLGAGSTPNCDSVPGGQGDTEIAVSAGSATGTTVDYNIVHPRPSSVGYTWAGARHLTPEAFSTATGQAKHDADQSIAFSPAGLPTVLELTDDATAAIDSADPAAPGILPTDLTGRPAIDSPLVPNTPGGNGRDRGARELQGLQQASVSVRGANFPTPQGAAPLVVKATASVQNNWPTTLTYVFDFRDGTPPVTTTDPTVEHTYTAVGTYRPQVTVQDSAGSKIAGNDYLGGMATVKEPAPLALSLGAEQTARPLEYRFTGGATSPWIVNGYAIDPGDGTGSVPYGWSHTYARPGSYNVTLTATDESGRSAGLTRTITVDYTDDMKDLISGERVRVLADARPDILPLNEASANHTRGVWHPWARIPSTEDQNASNNASLASAFTANGDLHTARVFWGGLTVADWHRRDFQWTGWLVPERNPINSGPVSQVSVAAIGNKLHVLTLVSGRVYQNTADYDTGRWGGWADVSAAAGVNTQITQIAAGATGNVLHIAMTDFQGRVLVADGNYDKGTWWSGDLPAQLGRPGGITQLSAATVGSKFHILALAGGSVYQATADYAAGGWNGWGNVSAVTGLAGGVSTLAAASTGNSLRLYAISGGHVYNATGDYTKGVWYPWADVTAPGAAGPLRPVANLTVAGAG